MRLYYISSNKLCNELSNEKIEQRYYDYDILVLDELSVEGIGFELNQILYTILNERWSNNKITIVTMNLKMESMFESKREDVKKIADRFMDYLKKYTGDKSYRGRK